MRIVGKLRISPPVNIVNTPQTQLEALPNLKAWLPKQLDETGLQPISFINIYQHLLLQQSKKSCLCLSLWRLWKICFTPQIFGPSNPVHLGQILPMLPLNHHLPIEG